MEINEVITLDDNKKYFILLENEYMEGDYYLAIEMDEHDNYTNNYCVFQLIKEGKDEYVEEIDNPDIISKLILDFELQYSDLAEEIKNAQESNDSNTEKE